MKKLKITVMGKTYEVLVEDMGNVTSDTPSIAPATPAVESIAVAPVSTVQTDGAKIPAPMNGTILEIAVKVGDTVKSGDTLCVLEAMKMQNAIPAPEDGTIAQVAVSVGASVEEGAVLIVMNA